MSDSPVKAKRIKINFANVQKNYYESSALNQKQKQAQTKSQNTSILFYQNVQGSIPPTPPESQRTKRGHLKSQSDHAFSKQMIQIPKVILPKENTDSRMSLWFTPRSTLTSARNTTTATSQIPKPYLSNERKSEVVFGMTPKSIEKGRASSLFSEYFMDTPKSIKVQKEGDKKKSTFSSAAKQAKLNQENILISKIKYLIKKHSKKQEKNELFKQPFYYYNQKLATEKDVHSKGNTRSFQFRSQGQIMENDQVVADNKVSIRVNNFTSQKSFQKLQRCISIQTDKLLSARHTENSKLQGSPYRVKVQSNEEIPSNNLDSNWKLIEEAASSSQHLIFEESPEKKSYQVFDKRAFSMHSTIVNFSNQQQDGRLTDAIRGKSSDPSPPRGAQQPQQPSSESNQFKIKLLQNLTEQIQIQTDLSKRFQNPLAVSRQEKRITQMIAAKMVPNTMSTASIKNIYEMRQQNMQNTPCSLQSFLESKLPYQSVLERQKQEKQVEESLRKNIHILHKRINLNNQSTSNPPSPKKQGLPDQTPESLFNLEDNGGLIFQNKCSIMLKDPLSPQKEKRSSQDFHYGPFDLDIQHNYQRYEDSSTNDEKAATSKRVSIQKDHAPLRIYKSQSTFYKNGFSVKIPDQQRKECESPSPSPKKQNMLANFIPSKIEKKHSELTENINKIQFKSLLSFAEKSQCAIFETEKNQRLKKQIDENIKKLSPHKQKSMNNQQAFRFETNPTNPTEPDFLGEAFKDDQIYEQFR